ncbi:MAG: hypothetical protein MUO64_06075 [Anaerolineales bacterium]|nr:hypothetical protein [Anaerolineales bacterium]
MVFQYFCSTTIDVTSNSKKTLRLSPIIKIRVKRFEKIIDLPIKLMKEPEPIIDYGIGDIGGGADYDHFFLSLQPKLGIFDAIFTPDASGKSYEYFEIKPEEQESCKLQINFEKGYYYWYQVGIEYINNGKYNIKWFNKPFCGARPLIMRVWYYRPLKNNDYLLTETDNIDLDYENNSKLQYGTFTQFPGLG